jgi:YVTN family beta-propeller protein
MPATLLVSFVLLLTIVAPVTAAEPKFRLLSRYGVGAGEAGHLRVDSDARRLYVARGTRVVVLDADSGKKIGEIAPTKGAQGVALAPELKRGFVTNGADDSITMFDTQSLKVLKVIKSGGTKPGAVEYDADTKRVFVCNEGSGDVTVIDAEGGSVTANIALGGTLRQLAANGFGHLFVTAPDRNLVHVIDTRALRPTGDFATAFALASGDQPTGLTLDRVGRRVFVACRNQRLLVLDADIGFPMPGMELAIAADPGDLAYDSLSRRTFLATGDGTVTVIQQQSNREGSFMAYAVVQKVPTTNGARTLAVDEKTHRVFVAGPKEVLVVGE